MSYNFIRPLSNGDSFPSGIIHVESGSTIKEDATILEIMDFLKATEKEKSGNLPEAVSRNAVLADVRAVITEMLLPNIDSLSDECDKMTALRNSYIDTYNNTIHEVLEKLSEHFI